MQSQLYQALVLVAVLVASPVAVLAQSESRDYQLTDVQEALEAVQNADTYDQILLALVLHEDLFAAPPVHQWLDEAISSDALTEEQRLFLTVTRLVAHDVQQYGATTAAQLLAVRYIAATAIARPAEELAALLGRYESFAPYMTPSVVRSALESTDGAEQDPRVALLEQLGIDWRDHGPLVAIERMADAAGAQTMSPSPDDGTRDGYSEDRIADGFLNLGQPIPDGLIYIPSQ